MIDGRSRGILTANKECVIGIGGGAVSESSEHTSHWNVMEMIERYGFNSVAMRGRFVVLVLVHRRLGRLNRSLKAAQSIAYNGCWLMSIQP